ncbi:unnamed protein product [Cuscuta campestris]|uniref:Uncharacterized protein n=1 Tax=Cuscuta campestris TaxID=132261 RepID=A0A484KKV1_9ASTE|nr:unnamed protein product [Cuscuta campestris]
MGANPSIKTAVFAVLVSTCLLLSQARILNNHLYKNDNDSTTVIVAEHGDDALENLRAFIPSEIIEISKRRYLPEINRLAPGGPNHSPSGPKL